MRILVADDDRRLTGIVKRGLLEETYAVDIAYDGAEAEYYGETGNYDLIILDIMMPEKDGLDVCRSLRAKNINTPILMLTARDAVEDRVKGLDAGADDYLVKPFAFSELAARVQALARRRAPASVATVLQAGGIEMDLLRREVRRAGRPIALQPREFRLLEELLRNAGEVVTRSMLLERVWDFHFDPQTKIVETHMSRLRAKLNDGFTEDAIETVRGAGYRVRT